MEITNAEYNELRDLVVQATEEGPITEWTERIAQLAKTLGLPTHMMTWSGSPHIVASSVVQYADNWSVIPELREELKK
jgi:hypothetical protein